MVAGFAQGGAAAKGFGAKMGSIGSGMATVGKGMTKYVTLPVLAMGAASVKFALDFEQSMTDVEALVGMSAKQVEGFKEQILQLAPAAGKGPRELGKAFYFIASSGLKGSSAMRALTASAKASAAGLGDTATIADAVTSAMNAYGEKALSASRATDILMAAVREGKSDPEEFAGSIGRVIPLAAKMGVSFGEVAGQMAAMSLNGTDANEAVTQISAMLASAIKPSKDGAAALKSIGMSYGDLRKEIDDKGLTKTVANLNKAFGGNIETLGKLFPNIRALRGFLALTGPEAAKYAGIIRDVGKAQGDTAKAFEIAMSKPGAKIKKAWAGIQSSMIEIGDVLLPVVEDAAESVASLTKSFSGLSDGTKEWAVKLAVGAAVFGPMILGIGKAITAVLRLRNSYVVAAAARAALTAAEGKGAAASGLSAAAKAVVGKGPGMLVTPAAVAAGTKLGAALAAGTKLGAALAAGFSIAAVAGVAAAVVLLQKDLNKQVGMVKREGALIGSRRLSRGGTNDPDPGGVIASAKAAQKKLVEIYKPITQKLQLRFETANYHEALKASDAVRAIQKMAEKGVKLNFAGMGDMGATGLSKIRTSLMDTLKMTERQATSVMTSIYKSLGGKGKLDFSWAKQTGEALKKTEREVAKTANVITGDLTKAGKSGGEGLAKGINRGQGPTRAAAKGLTTAAAVKLPNMVAKGLKVSSDVAKGVGKTGPTKAAAARLAAAGTPHMPDGFGLGAALGAGVAAGLASQLGSVQRNAARIAEAAAAGIRITGQIRSPSKVTWKLGIQFAEGFANGIKAGTMKAASAASQLASDVLSILESALGIGDAVTQMKGAGLPTQKVAKQWAKKAAGLVRAMVGAMKPELAKINLGKKDATKNRFGAAAELAGSMASIFTAFTELSPESVTKALAGIKAAKSQARTIAAAVASMVKDFRKELKKLIVSEGEAGSAERATGIAGNIADLIGTFSGVTGEKGDAIDKAVAGIKAAEAKASELARAMKSLVNKVVVAITGSTADDAYATLAGNAASIAGSLAGTISTFAELTAGGIDKAVAGLDYATAKAPHLAASMARMVGALQVSLANVTATPEFVALVDSVASVVGNITGVISGLTEMTEKAVQNGIWGAGWVALKAVELGDALRKMVGWLVVALQGIDATSLAALQASLAVLAEISASISGIVNNLAEMTAEKLAAATLAGSSLGEGFYAGLLSWHERIVAEAARIAADTAVALAGGSSAGAANLSYAGSAAGSSGGSTTVVQQVAVQFNGDINATSPEQAKAAGAAVGAAAANTAITKLAAAKRATAKSGGGR